RLAGRTPVGPANERSLLRVLDRRPAFPAGLAGAAVNPLPLRRIERASCLATLPPLDDVRVHDLARRAQELGELLVRHLAHEREWIDAGEEEHVGLELV